MGLLPSLRWSLGAALEHEVYLQVPSFLTRPNPERKALQRLRTATRAFLALHALPKGAEEAEVRRTYRELLRALQEAERL
jgi:hypothetical protein